MTAFLNADPYDRTELFEKSLVQEISKSQVSALAKGLDAEIAAWRKRPQEAVDTLVPTHPKVAALLDLHGEEMLAVYALPAHHQRRMRTTYIIERFNEEIRRRNGVIHIFPNDAACVQIVSALTIENNEEWRNESIVK